MYEKALWVSEEAGALHAAVIVAEPYLRESQTEPILSFRQGAQLRGGIRYLLGSVKVMYGSSRFLLVAARIVGMTN